LVGPDINLATHLVQFAVLTSLGLVKQQNSLLFTAFQLRAERLLALNSGGI
jgi:hypothetical protein